MRHGNLHPSRTERGTMKIRDLATGAVLERWSPDARELVGGGAFVFVPYDTPSIAETLGAMSVADLQAFAQEAGMPGMAHAPREDLIARLTRAVEEGRATLDTPT